MRRAATAVVDAPLQKSAPLRDLAAHGSVVSMHPSSYDKMARFRAEYLRGRERERLTIYDIGSQDINGSYRPLFSEPTWRYIGVDMAPGKNVDLLLKNPYHWREIAAGSADVVISGQTFEHTEFFWETTAQIVRALKVGGLCCILAPSAGPEHQYPVDCWRVYPDGFRAVARYAGLEVLEATAQWDDLPQYDDESNKWHDAMLVARKRHEPLSVRAVRALHTWISQKLPDRDLVLSK